MMRDFEKKGEITGATWVFTGSLLTIILVLILFASYHYFS